MRATGVCGYLVFVAALGAGVGCDGSSDISTTGSSSLNGVTFAEKFTCSQAFTGQPEFCADLNVTDDIRFTETTANAFTVLDVPDSGFVLQGNLVGTVFTWTAVSPNGYTEAGSWTFTSDLSSFAGSSHYVADDGTYAGDCNETGVQSGVPPDPPTIGACP